MSPPKPPRLPLKPAKVTPREFMERKYTPIKLLYPAVYQEFDEEGFMVDEYVPITDPSYQEQRGDRKVGTSISFADLEKMLPPGIPKDQVFLDLDVEYSDYNGQTNFNSLALYHDVLKNPESYQNDLAQANQDFADDMIEYEKAMEKYKQEFALYDEKRRKYEIAAAQSRIKREQETLEALQKKS